MNQQRHGRGDGLGATAGFLNTDWNPRDLPLGATTRNVVLRTADGAATSGALYAAGASDTVVCIMHPREFMACHYLIPDIVGAGYAAWTQAPRAVGNDMRLEHELALFDVAAAMRFLRDAGFRRIALLGNSGGSGLYALYVQQSGLAPEARIERTPGGRPTRLAALDMPVVDGVVFVAPHPGQGALLQSCIDPSVTDEHDALSVDPTLDPFDGANGYVARRADADASVPSTPLSTSPSTRYAPDFVERYRAAQTARVARIDAMARDLIAARQAARERLRRDGANAAAHVRRLAAHTPLMTVWRTDADLRCFDLSLDPSDRRFGSLWGSDPFASNYGSVGFGRVCSPEAWLSTWSGLSSNALLSKTASAIVQPTLLIEYTGDQACFPSVIADIHASLGASHKTHRRVRGDHHGRALAPGEEAGRYVAGRLLQDWLRETFPQ
ncbi:alpha/beta hydrolase [Pandoraea pnomenusa]|uniref:alpha/beta hydrolase n=1 Tax=Pandoraea pnomenusa TaxID=93220 RepID=UPI003CF408CA